MQEGNGGFRVRVGEFKKEDKEAKSASTIHLFTPIADQVRSRMHPR